MSCIREHRDGAVVTLTLDDPSSLNALSPDMLDALAVAIRKTTSDPEVVHLS